MDCPHCGSTETTEQPNRTKLGYRRFRCLDCGRSFNERTGTPFNRLQYPTDVVCLVALWRLRYKLSLRDLAEMFLQGSDSNGGVSRANGLIAGGNGATMADFTRHLGDV